MCHATSQDLEPLLIGSCSTDRCSRSFRMKKKNITIMHFSQGVHALGEAPSRKTELASPEKAELRHNFVQICLMHHERDSVNPEMYTAVETDDGRPHPYTS